MSYGVLVVVATLVVVLLLSVLSIVVSTSKGAAWSESWWRDGDRKADAPETHRRHARHHRPGNLDQG